MDLDAEVCLCFHVSRRKLTNYARRHRIKVASQLSECGGAGTGCGWCVPFLRQIFKQATDGTAIELERLTPEEYARGRGHYVRTGSGSPPAGATPIPEES